jgi:hypothetical protein
VVVQEVQVEQQQQQQELQAWPAQKPQLLQQQQQQQLAAPAQPEAKPQPLQPPAQPEAKQPQQAPGMVLLQPAGPPPQAPPAKAAATPAPAAAAKAPALPPTPFSTFVHELPLSWQLPSTSLSTSDSSGSALELLKILSSSTVASLGSAAALRSTLQAALAQHHQQQQQQQQQQEAEGAALSPTQELPDSWKLPDSSLAPQEGDIAAEEFEQLMRQWSDTPLSALLPSLLASASRQLRQAAGGGSGAAAPAPAGQEAQANGEAGRSGSTGAVELLQLRGTQSSSTGAAGAAAVAGQPACAAAPQDPPGNLRRISTSGAAAAALAHGLPPSPAPSSAGRQRSGTPGCEALSAPLRRITNSAHFCGTPGGSRQGSRSASSSGGSLQSTPRAPSPFVPGQQDSWRSGPLPGIREQGQPQPLQAPLQEEIAEP